jgi:hypothetical protein
MMNGTLEILLGDIALYVQALPLVVVLTALRRAVLSTSRNFVRYAGVAGVALAVLQANVLCHGMVEPAVQVLTAVATLALWVHVRALCDRRRRAGAHRFGPGTRGRY